jgi:MOSC domain-containing protein YiiM
VEPAVAGRIIQLNRKPKEGRGRGLPKRPVPELTITPYGVVGDYNRWRTEKAAGDPDQAVLLATAEDLASLRADGWPVEPGELGENLTVAGLPPGSLGAGARVRVDDVVLEVSKACDPCTILYGLPYVGMERGGKFLHAVRGRRGWFARVVRGGTVRVGMPVTVLSALLPAATPTRAAL